MQFLPSHHVKNLTILDLSNKLFVASFPKLIGYFGVMAVPPVVAELMVFIVIGVFPEEVRQSMLGQDANPMLGIVVFLLFFVFVLLYLVSSPGMIYRIDNVANLREDSLEAAF